MQRHSRRTGLWCAARRLLLAILVLTAASAAWTQDAWAGDEHAEEAAGLEQATAAPVVPDWRSVKVLTPSPELIPSVTARAAMGLDAPALRVAVDPETGELRAPVREERSEMSESETLQPRLNRSSEGLRAVTLIDGTELLNLQGRFLSAAQVEVLPDGSHQFQCRMETEEEIAARHARRQSQGAVKEVADVQ